MAMEKLKRYGLFYSRCILLLTFFAILAYGNRPRSPVIIGKFFDETLFVSENGRNRLRSTWMMGSNKYYTLANVHVLMRRIKWSGVCQGKTLRSRLLYGIS